MCLGCTFSLNVDIKNILYMSKLYFIQSPMNGSKSALLLMKAHSFEERGISFICMKPTIDTRDGTDVIVSRVGIKRECIAIEKEDNIFNIVKRTIEECNTNNVKPPQWILVDESQFLTKEHIEQLSNVVDFLDINVLCYGLRTDFMTDLFEGSKRLMELADDIDEIKISCSCGRKAIVNARINELGEVITNGEQILIGGNDQYIPLCRKCYKNAILDNIN